MQTSLSFRFPFAKALVLGMALAPVTLLAQSTAPADPSAATQDQQGPPPHGEHGNPAERQAHMLKMMTKRLDLSPDQVTQIQGIQADSLSQMQARRGDTSTQDADKHAKMMEIHKAETEKIRAVLNDQQKAKFDAMQQHRHDHMEGQDRDNAQPPAQQ